MTALEHHGPEQHERFEKSSSFVCPARVNARPVGRWTQGTKNNNVFSVFTTMMEDRLHYP
jgi:hypothetical protein